MAATAEPLTYAPTEESDARGIVVVAAAGDAGPGDVSNPARDPRTIPATGLHLDGARMRRAGSGPTIDLGSPAFEIVAPWPHTRDGYGSWTGTSFAAPFVTRVLALATRARNMPPAVLRDWMLETTRPYEELPPPARMTRAGGVS